MCFKEVTKKKKRSNNNNERTSSVELLFTSSWGKDVPIFWEGCYFSLLHLYRK